MRPLPPRWPDYIPGLPLLFVFVGAPDAFEHARRERNNGFFNHVVLADAVDADQYQWPTRDLMVVVILFHDYSATVEKTLLAALRADEPAELAVRYWPTRTVQEVIR